MNKLLESYNLPRMNQEEIESLHRTITNKVIESYTHTHTHTHTERERERGRERERWGGGKRDLVSLPLL